MFLTPNGRFETGTRICLSVTSHHEELWQPSWGIRTILTALVGFMPSKPTGLGSLDYPDKERVVLAKKSVSYECPRCGAAVAAQLPPLAAPPAVATEVVPSPAIPTALAAAPQPAPSVAAGVAAAGEGDPADAAADASLAASNTAPLAGVAAALLPPPGAATAAARRPLPTVDAGGGATAAGGITAVPSDTGAPAGVTGVALPPAAGPLPVPGASGLRQRGGAGGPATPPPAEPRAVPRRPAGERELSNDSGGEEALLMAAWFVASIIGGLLARRLALTLL